MNWRRRNDGRIFCLVQLSYAYIGRRRWAFAKSMATFQLLSLSVFVTEISAWPWSSAKNFKH